MRVFGWYALDGRLNASTIAGTEASPSTTNAVWYPSVSTSSPPTSSDVTGPIREIDW